MGSSESKKAQKSIEAQKLREFFSYYGYKAGPEIELWIQGMYSPNFYGSTTFNFGQSKTKNFKRQDLPGIYERALQGKYRSSNIQFYKVDPKARIIYYRWVNNTPHASDSSRRVDIPFDSYVVFDEHYRFLKTVHNHVPVKKMVQQIQSERRGYFEKCLDRAESNMKIVNNLLSQNYYPDPNSDINRNYEESQKRFRQNQNKQVREYNNWVNAQNNRYY